MISPTCCPASTQYQTVSIFVPAGARPAHWAVPYRNTDDNTLVERGVTAARFCPFCGTRLTLEHLHFGEEP